ncbi:MAG: 3-dehydroquinate synthase [Elusimicrobiaceae bacterium]|nr:3-dehydroquinate synthase [Elusimicrobiaceae bacterium]
MNARLGFLVDGHGCSCALPGRSGELAIRSALGGYKVVFRRAGEGFRQINGLAGEGAFFLIDGAVLRLHRKRLKLPVSRVLAVKAGEQLKTLAGVKKIFSFLNKNNFTRADRLVIIGGGTVQDSGGFAAACYKRGVRWTFAPTTLLSMCDSCIGAKTGVNFERAKNQLGVFYAPEQVIVEPDFLLTLPACHVRSGLGEILKLAVTGGPAALGLYRRLFPAAAGGCRESLNELVKMSLSVKKAVIELDEFEKHYRKTLNYGHTVGHALETLSRYKISHGLAIAMGMAAANELAVSRGLLAPDDCAELNRLCVLLADRGLPSLVPAHLLALLKKDKKAGRNGLTLALCAKAGDLRLVTVKPDLALAREIVAALKNNFR